MLLPEDKAQSSGEDNHEKTDQEINIVLENVYVVCFSPFIKPRVGVEGIADLCNIHFASMESDDQLAP